MRSRTNSVYVMCFFVGGVLVSLPAGFAYSYFT